jgi:heme-degrading monooxygenase HmoA
VLITQHGEGVGVIARVWRGWTRTADGHHYVEHYRTEVLPGLRQIDGFRDARLLRRTVSDETEFVSLTFFEDIEAIKAFAGVDYEAAVVADEARRVLIRFDERVVHYDVNAQA